MSTHYFCIKGYTAINARVGESPMSATTLIVTQPLSDIKVEVGAIQGNVYAGDLTVTVKSGSITGWTLVSPVNITVSPSTIQHCTLDDKKPLTVGDSGSADGTFSNGESTDVKTITLTISNSGQNKVGIEE